jgi:hypothetical protein
MSAPGVATAQIQVRTRFFPLAFLLVLFKPVVSIDGVANTVAWGVTSVPVTPGPHVVEAWCPYLFFRTMGRSGINVDVPPGGAVQVVWTTAWLAFLPGKIQVVGATPPASYGGPAPAGYGAAPAAFAATQAPAPAPPRTPTAGAWHPDPSGRHPYRWFDGTEWTAAVSDGQTQGTDPL